MVEDLVLGCQTEALYNLGRMIAYQLLTIIILAAVCFIPRLLDPSIAYFIYGYSILLLPLFLKQVREKILSKDLTTLFFVFFLIFASLSTYFSADKERSLISLGLYFSYFVIFTSIGQVFKNFSERKLLIGALVALPAVLSAVFAQNSLVNHYVNRAVEGVSFRWFYFGHGHLSALLILAIPLTVFFLQSAKRGSKKLLPGLALGFLGLVLILTRSRASIFSLAISCSLLLLFWKKWPYKKKIALTLAVIAGAVLLAGAVSSPAAGVKKYFNFQKDARVVYWQAAVNNFLSHPFTGTGPDTFRYVAFPATNPPVLKSFYTHNFFIQMLTDTGVFGFLTSLLLIGSVLKRGFMTVSEKAGSEKLFYLLLTIGLLASIFNNMVDFDWQLPSVFFAFWLLAGLL